MCVRLEVLGQQIRTNKGRLTSLAPKIGANLLKKKKNTPLLRLNRCQIMRTSTI